MSKGFLNTLRTALAAASVLLLLAGYMASQWAALNGQAAEYAAKVDQAPIRILALFILVVAIALAFVRDPGDT